MRHRSLAACAPTLPRGVSESGFDAASIRQETLVYDGPVRGIAALYPRNVNTMVTCALATTGLDACHARLVAVPLARRARRAVGADDFPGHGGLLAGVRTGRHGAGTCAKVLATIARSSSSAMAARATVAAW